MYAVSKDQADICRRFGVDPFPAGADLKVGVARNVGGGLQPINGLRHSPDDGTTGWFIWAGEDLRNDEDFFEPLHVNHLPDRCPDVLPYLALPPGWRFLLAPGHEDAWFDAHLLQTRD